jgi:putative endonuclease
VYKSSLKHTGYRGEQLAADFLTQKGFTIVSRNHTSRWGELDIIAVKNMKYHFVEVKTRLNDFHGKPYEAVHSMKIHHLLRTIQHYILEHNLQNRKVQLDVIAIIITNDKVDLRYYENVELTRYLF